MSTQPVGSPSGPGDSTPKSSQGPLEDLELHAWRSFVAMQEQIRTGVERELQDHCNLSLADYTVLAVLSDAAGKRRRPFELCADLGWEKSRLHHQLTRMSRRGLIQRHSDSANPGSRAVYVELTAAGLTAVSEAAPAHARQVRRFLLDHLSRHHIEQLGEIASLVIAGNCATSAGGADPP